MSQTKLYTPPRILKALRWLALGTPSERRRVRQELARIAASLFGDYPISDDYKLWREEKDFLLDYKRLSPHNPYSEDRKYMLREFVRFTGEVPGVMAECGCYRGASAWFMAKEVPDTPLYLFDSFSGLSEPSEFDKQKRQDHQSWGAGDLSAGESAVMETLKEFTNVVIYNGWIPERFPEVAGQVFRVVHIDVDLYQPTFDSLAFFYPRVSPGGVIVLDDFGSTICPGAHRAIVEYMSDKPEYVLHLTTGQGVIIKKNP